MILVLVFIFVSICCFLLHCIQIHTRAGKKKHSKQHETPGWPPWLSENEIDSHIDEVTQRKQPDNFCGSFSFWPGSCIKQECRNASDDRNDHHKILTPIVGRGGAPIHEAQCNNQCEKESNCNSSILPSGCNLSVHIWKCLFVTLSVGSPESVLA